MTQYWRFCLGAILVLIVVLFPRGLVGLGQTLWTRCAHERSAWPDRDSAARGRRTALSANALP